MHYCTIVEKLLFLGIQVLLNVIGILLCPFIGFAISHKVIVGQVGRAVGVAVLLVVSRVVGVGDCHELVGQAKVQMTLVRSPYQLSLVSSQVRSIWHHLPSIFTAFGVAVAGDAAVGDARGVKELG